MVDSPKPMQEKMTWFWHGHFCSSWDKVNSAWAMLEQNKLFRDSAFGNFRTLTQTMSMQPAMLFYLDNLDNVKSSPNQNFARELMELFTIGVVDQNGDPNYTEDDVTAAARAWTGHGIDWNTYHVQVLDRRPRHRAEDVHGVRPATGTGPTSSTTCCRRTWPRSCVACKFLTKKLWEFFAYQNPSQALIDELAQVLYDNDLRDQAVGEGDADARRVLQPGRDAGPGASRRSTSSSPVLLHRATGARPEPAVVRGGMGQVPFGPPNVAGWKTNGYWVNTSVFGVACRVRPRRHVAAAEERRQRRGQGPHPGRRRSTSSAAMFGRRAQHRDPQCRSSTSSNVQRSARALDRLVGEHATC